ncbi:MAG: LPS-assembly protein LptD, partial [Elusimicrobia bacterium]|nr:LPS-assembly protein LptD [Elusimicrobiota bacterium]
MKTKTSTLLVGLFLGMSLGLLGGGPGGVLWASEAAGAVVEETAGAVPDEAGVTDPESPDEVVPPAGNSVELNGDSVEYDPKGGKFVASGNVVIRQNNAVLFCDQVEFYREKQEAYATGNVVLKSDQGTIWAEKGFYHFGKKLGEFTHARIIADPVYGEAKTISKVGDNYFVMSEGYITTSDYDNPE